MARQPSPFLVFTEREAVCAATRTELNRKEAALTRALDELSTAEAAFKKEQDAARGVPPWEIPQSYFDAQARFSRAQLKKTEAEEACKEARNTHDKAVDAKRCAAEAAAALIEKRYGAQRVAYAAV